MDRKAVLVCSSAAGARNRRRVLLIPGLSRTMTSVETWPWQNVGHNVDSIGWLRVLGAGGSVRMCRSRQATAS